MISEPQVGKLRPKIDIPGLNSHLKRALGNLCALQHEGGEWEAEMVWNTMLLSQVVLTKKIVGRAISPGEREKILHHYRVSQLADGSWPMHIEGHGYVFMTSLAYVALRVLGVDRDDPLCARARTWLRSHGGVLAVPSWGKFWLAMVGLYEWEGVNSIPPELFLLPDWLPVQPNNFYCHTRYIYLSISYLYGKRFRADLGPLTDELRAELYDENYRDIDFAKYRHEIAAGDLFVRPSQPLRRAWDALALYEKRPVKPLRALALEKCFTRIRYEIEASRGQGISPVNGLLNCLALFSVDPHDRSLPAALDAMEKWKWEDEAEGIRYCGAHSTSWDTAFALRALMASPDPSATGDAIRRGYRWLVDAQMQEELGGREDERRDPIKGGWCFSDGVHRWAVSDCAAEALSSILAVHESTIIPAKERIPDDRLEQAVRFILLRQNADGGFGSYERRRGSVLLEWINPSEMYANCMTERSYTECTASCVAALARYRDKYPKLMRGEIDAAIARGVELLRARQREDGSWAGFWGVNFTYAVFHVIEALRAAGAPADDPAIARAASWLQSVQKDDGGWGEHFESCLKDAYVEHRESQATMTAWALLALTEALPSHNPTIARGVAFLRALQQNDGAWPRQSQAGVFFATAMLDYRLYKDVFPTWALARHACLLATGATTPSVGALR